jgi:hypothetical protein
MSTLKSLTKAELVTLVQERNATIEGLRLELSIAKITVPAARPRTPEQLAFHLQCEAARSLAMRTGKCVKVAAA